MKHQELKKQCDDIYRQNFEPYLSGRRDLFTGIMAAFMCRGHVLIEGPPGTAKTLVAKLFAKTFSKTFKRIQFTFDLLPLEIVGSSVYHPRKGEFKFIAGPLFADIVLADEINRAPPRTQSAFLEAMEERQLTVEGNTVELGDNFFVVATQNPLDYEGTHPLPEVQLDRFLFSFKMEHSSLDQEVDIVQRHLDKKLPPNLNDLKTLEVNLVELRILLASVRVSPENIKYAAQIVRATRENPLFKRGASLRAILAIIKGAQVHAALSGRESVRPADVKEMSLPALRHRIELSAEAKMGDKSTEQVLAEVIAKIEQPSGTWME
jgi:MoxR-like ATPase